MKKLLFCLFSLVSIFASSQPVVHSISPASGAANSVIEVRGRGFGSTPQSNFVFFGGARAKVQEASDTLLRVITPEGASYSPISVTAGGLTAYSSQYFILKAYTIEEAPLRTHSFFPLGFSLPTSIDKLFTADFDDDGLNDLLVSSAGETINRVFRNESASLPSIPRFPTQVTLSKSNAGVSTLAVADFNGDGKLDIVASSGDYLGFNLNQSNTGTILFTSTQFVFTHHGIRAIATGDLNGDGKPDVIVAHNTAAGFSVYINTTSSAMLTFNRIDIQLSGKAEFLAVRDIDGDGKADILVSESATEKALVLLKNTSNDNDLSFDTSVVVTPLQQNLPFELADFNDDGYCDLAVIGVVQDSITIFRNRPGSGKNPFFATSSVPVARTASDIKAGSLSGDSRIDLVVKNSDTVLAVFKNTTKKELDLIMFDTAETFKMGKIADFAVSDLNRDGRSDIVIGSTQLIGGRLLANQHCRKDVPFLESFYPKEASEGDTITLTGYFSAAEFVTIEGHIANININPDGRSITAKVVRGNSGSVQVIGVGGFTSLPGFVLKGHSVTGLIPISADKGDTVDVYGHQFQDITDVSFGGVPATYFEVVKPGMIRAVVGDGNTGAVSVKSMGHVSEFSTFMFAPPKIYSITPLSATVGSTVVIYGKNFGTEAAKNIVHFGAARARVISAADGRLEVEVPRGATAASITIAKNNLSCVSHQQFIPTFDGNGSNISASDFSHFTTLNAAKNPVAVQLHDVNGDGRNDVIVADANTKSLFIHIKSGSKGSTNFDLHKLSMSVVPREIYLADIDGDGKLDMLVLSGNDMEKSALSIFRNLSNTTEVRFAEPYVVQFPFFILSCATGDMNRDGRPDLFALSNTGGSMYLYVNFTIPGKDIEFRMLGSSGYVSATDFVASDLDGNGRLDLMMAAYGSGQLWLASDLFLSYTNPKGEPKFINPNLRAMKITLADLDMDGLPELLASKMPAYKLAYLKNVGQQGNPIFESVGETNSRVTKIVLADFNGDGYPDLANEEIWDHITIYQNSPELRANFAVGEAINLHGSPGRLVTGDVNEDGKPDLIALYTNLKSIEILRNNINDKKISEVTPMEGGEKTVVTIRLNSSEGVESVSFGGVPADTFKIVGPGVIEAVVGRGNSGRIIVSKAGEQYYMDSFIFIPSVWTNGKTNICDNIPIELSTTPIGEVQWFLDDMMLDGSTHFQHNASQPGTYKVRLRSNNFESYSAPLTITYKVTDRPKISKDSAGNLVSNIAGGNQWYFNGATIAGATGSIFRPVQNGHYSVTFSFDSCVSDMSDQFLYDEIDEVQIAKALTAYPNPSADKFILTWPIDGDPLLDIEIYDSYGKIAARYERLERGAFVSLANLKQGVFIIKATDRNTGVTRTTRIMKK